MRRLIGLIALLIIILGAAWFVRDDVDLRQVAGVRTFFEPQEPAGEAPQPVETAAEAPESSAPADGDESDGGEAVIAALTGDPDTTASEASGAATTTEAEAEVPTTDESAAEDTSEPMASGGEMAEAMPPEPDPMPDSVGESEGGIAAPESVVDADGPPAETETAMAEAPASDVSAADAEMPVGIVPSFDIVRVEPSGETVVAGLSAPMATVEVLNGTEPVATAEANARGEWALVLDEPLPPGTHDLAIRTTTADRSEVTLSDQRVAVAVPENADEEPLVVMNAPDGPSQIIQVPEDVPAEVDVATDSGESDGTEIASAGEPENEAMSGADDTMAAPEMATPSETETVAEPEVEVAAAPAPEVMQEPAMPSAETETAAAAPEAPADPTQAEPMFMPSTPLGDAESPAADAPSGAGDSAAMPLSSDAEATTMEEAPPPVIVEEPAPIVPKVGVAAVEAETNGALFIAGTATTPEPVRVYVDDEFLGEAVPTEGGTWLLETQREMAPDSYTVRADQVDATGGAVIARAEVPFEREIEVAVIEQSGESAGAGQAEISGGIAGPTKVIIKRGDNLWRISREMYGKGVRYSTIYQANRDQIRNPNLIFPGQVFVLPEGNTAWDE